MAMAQLRTPIFRSLYERNSVVFYYSLDFDGPIKAALNDTLRVVDLKCIRGVMLALGILVMSVSIAKGAYRQPGDHLLEDAVMAIAYSGYREGQHPDRGEGASNPTEAQILEDLKLLVEADFNLIRLYDAGENSLMVLKLIDQHALPIRVLLGAWLRAEISNHERCAWLIAPIPDKQLALNKLENAAEVERSIALANKYPTIVIAVNVGNEALVDWNDHLVSLNNVIAYVKQVKRAIGQPVTVAENYDWWVKEGTALAAEVDFIGVHTYPIWEDKSIDQALSFTIENIEAVHRALPESPIAILEAGWATIAQEFGSSASEGNQLRYYQEIKKWAAHTNTTVFFFEAFDEPWKGDPLNPRGAEKHWGVFNVDRTPKRVIFEAR